MAGHIAILGVFVADAAFRAGRLPRMGETMLGDGFALGPGGKGSNQAVAAARLGAAAHLISRLGRDTFAEMALDLWAGAGVTPVVARSDAAPTGAAFIFVERGSGDNAIIICPGAAAEISVADVEAAADTIRGAAVFVTQLEQPMDAALRALEIARAAGVTTILNPAPAAALPEGMLALADYVTPNETEAEALTGLAVTTEADAERAADALIARGAGAAVITLGARGALLRRGSASTLIPAIAAGAVVETTGAGDAFNAGFAVALAEGRDPAAAVRLGCAAAGLSVTRAGAAAAMPTRAEVEALMGAG